MPPYLTSCADFGKIGVRFDLPTMPLVRPRFVRMEACFPRAAGRLTAGILSLIFFAAVPAAAQDSPAATESNLPEGHSPRGALWRAAALPGWGQYYNRQYYKIPIVWIGIAGIAGSALAINQDYLLYRHAFHYVSRRDADGNPLFPEYRADFERVTEGIPTNRALQLASYFRQRRDNLRRNRDLLYIGVGLFYGLTVLDAYVNAHLLEFDVGEDLTLAVYPAPTGLSATLRIGR